MHAGVSDTGRGRRLRFLSWQTKGRRQVMHGMCTCRVVLASCMSPLLKYSSISASAWAHRDTGTQVCSGCCDARRQERRFLPQLTCSHMPDFAPLRPADPVLASQQQSRWALRSQQCKQTLQCGPHDKELKATCPLCGRKVLILGLLQARAQRTAASPDRCPAVKLTACLKASTFWLCPGLPATCPPAGAASSSLLP